MTHVPQLGISVPSNKLKSAHCLVIIKLWLSLPMAILLFLLHVCFSQSSWLHVKDYWDSFLLLHVWTCNEYPHYCQKDITFKCLIRCISSVLISTSWLEASILEPQFSLRSIFETSNVNNHLHQYVAEHKRWYFNVLSHKKK